MTHRHSSLQFQHNCPYTLLRLASKQHFSFNFGLASQELDSTFSNLVFFSPTPMYICFPFMRLLNIALTIFTKVDLIFKPQMIFVMKNSKKI